MFYEEVSDREADADEFYSAGRNNRTVLSGLAAAKRGWEAGPTAGIIATTHTAYHRRRGRPRCGLPRRDRPLRLPRSCLALLGSRIRYISPHG